MMEFATEALVFAESGMMLAALAITLQHLNRLSGRLVVLFIVTVLCFLLEHLDIAPAAPFFIRLSLNLGLLVLAWAFWVLSLAVFDDTFKLRWLHWSVLLAKVGIGFYTMLPDPSQLLLWRRDPGFALRSIPTVLFSLVLIISTIIEAGRGNDSDLVEGRRKLRKIYIYCIGGTILYILLSYFFFPDPKYLPIINVMNLAIAGLLILGFFFAAVQYRSDIFPDVEEAKDRPAPVFDDPALREKLIRCFEEDRIYREEGLTIRQLADRLNAQEYRLRRLINGAMGFRNFNDFLNRYRIQEACEILSAGDKSDMPLIRLAMHVGYPSPGPFNRAFRQITGMTPSEFRKSNPETKIQS
ncbi:MAG: helix-turn-helix domain-containing protein [Leptospiraceae bacterium]|nr:helix-turn-helix domain-containing protein [Leptospiraceae bacterium]